MIWNDYFIWAGIILGTLELFHFLRERKLPDLRTKLLTALMVVALVLCALSVTVTFQRKHRLVTSVLAMLPVTGVYLCKIWLPYGLLCLSCVMMRRLRHKALGIGLLPPVAGTFMVLSSLWTGFVSYPMADGLTHVGEGYPIYVWGVFAEYCAVLVFILYHRKTFKISHITGLLEMALLNMTGIFLQSVFLIQLVDGFMSILGLSFIFHFSNNPYAYIDFSTRVFNREYFNCWMWEKGVRKCRVFVVGVYLPGIENLQSTYGEIQDMYLLETIARRLWQIAPRHEVFRTSHNQFVLCTNSMEEQERIVQELLALFQRRFQTKGKARFCPAMIAPVQDRSDFYDSTVLQFFMDYLFRNEEKLGRVQRIAEDEQVYDRYLYEKQIEHFLEDAVEEDLFEVWYQPIWSVEKQKFIVLEALGRLKHPEAGWISPQLFFKIAAEKGLIFQIMPIQIRKICCFLKQNEEALKDIEHVKINLTAVELADPFYIDRLAEQILREGISPNQIQFEVTENIAVHYTKEIEESILSLKKKGIRLCMDDFGTGYSNVSSMLQLPYSGIKLDRSLLQGVCQDPKRAALYHDIVSTFRILGYQVIAEGVETREEADLLSEWGVDLIQGYYYARPQPEEDLLKLIYG